VARGDLNAALVPIYPETPQILSLQERDSRVARGEFNAALVPI